MSLRLRFSTTGQDISSRSPKSSICGFHEEFAADFLSASSAIDNAISVAMAKANVSLEMDIERNEERPALPLLAEVTYISDVKKLIRHVLRDDEYASQPKLVYAFMDFVSSRFILVEIPTRSMINRSPRWITPNELNMAYVSAYIIQARGRKTRSKCCRLYGTPLFRRVTPLQRYSARIIVPVTKHVAGTVQRGRFSKVPSPCIESAQAEANYLYDCTVRKSLGSPHSVVGFSCLNGNRRIR